MIIDSHVHLFPPRVYDAIWRWFDRHAWNIRYRLYADGVIEHLAKSGIDRVVGLCYSHVPGMARDLNRFMAELGRVHGDRVIPFGTVLPGEPDADVIVDEAIALGLRGFKIHCHVQKLGPDDPRLEPIYRRAAAAHAPIVIHAGREPCFPAYGVDTHAFCSVAATRRALERHPDLVMIVAHLGTDEETAYFELLAEFPNLHLDTTMVLSGQFSQPVDPERLERHADRILYGTDFPNIPYEWDRELRWLERNVCESARQKICFENATRLL